MRAVLIRFVLIMHNHLESGIACDCVCVCVYAHTLDWPSWVFAICLQPVPPGMLLFGGCCGLHNRHASHDTLQ